VLCLRLVLQLVAYGRAIVLGLEKPVAVPLIESAAEQAAREAETLQGAD
ncbi:MAG: TRAP transporter small permease, partial [Pseudomonadota bacterium]